MEKYLALTRSDSRTDSRTRGFYREAEKEPQEFTTRRVHGDIEEVVDEIDLRFERFKNFDQIFHAPWDHQFINQFRFHQYRRPSSRKIIEQEWEKLEKALPNSPIFVRTYTDSSDLMRAVVIGPPNTPYDNGLFVFDIFLPGNYPDSPLKIHHRSSIPDYLDKNQECGVPDFDKWFQNQKADTGVLDVLVAIYKSYLCSPPYKLSSTERAQSVQSRVRSCFLGIPELVEFVKSEQHRNLENMRRDLLESQKYDKLVFLYTCKKMIVDITDPPADFREFVPGYFRGRSHNILWKVKENMDDSYAMFVLFEHLYTVLGDAGAYVNHFSGFLEEKRKQHSGSGTESTDVDNGVISMLKQSLTDFFS